MIFIDTNVLVAYAVKKDINHARAEKLINLISTLKFGNMVISDYVFDETITVISARTKSLEEAVVAGNYIRESMIVLNTDESTFEETWRLFKAQKKSRLSFTDCEILSIMKEYNIGNLATFDGEFKNVESVRIIENT